MKNTFYMLVGLPGSGKTSLAMEFLEKENKNEKDQVWLSSDAIREELYGSAEEQENPQAVFAEMNKRMKDALEKGKDVIYDACNINSKKRRALLNEIKRFSCEKVCIICATPYHMCVERSSKRDRVVKEDVIKRMYLTWNTPYYYEGWDRILINYADNTKGYLGKPEDFVESLMEYEQDTPYHLETLGAHMRGFYAYLTEQKGYESISNVAIAGLIHDCGKPFTKIFADSRGNKTEIAHYYNHQCAGAYDALFFDYHGKTEEDMLEISTLVNLHMEPFMWGEKETNEKRERFWGKEIYKKVLDMHEADQKSSIRGI